MRDGIASVNPCRDSAVVRHNVATGCPERDLQEVRIRVGRDVGTTKKAPTQLFNHPSVTQPIQPPIRQPGGAPLRVGKRLG